MFPGNQPQRGNLERANRLRDRQVAALGHVQEMVALNQNVDANIPAGNGYQENFRRMESIIGKACISFFSDGKTSSLDPNEEQLLSNRVRDNLPGLPMKQILEDSSFSNLPVETHRFQYSCRLSVPPEPPEPQSYYLWRDENNEYRLLIVHPDPDSERFAHLVDARKPQREESEPFNLTKREHVKKDIYIRLLNKLFRNIPPDRIVTLEGELSLWFASLSRFNKTTIKYKDIFWSRFNDRNGLSALFCSYLSTQIGEPQDTLSRGRRPALVWSKTYGAAIATGFGNFFSVFGGNWGKGSMYYRSNPVIRPDDQGNGRDDVGAIIGAIAHRFTKNYIAEVETEVKRVCTRGIRR